MYRATCWLEGTEPQSPPTRLLGHNPTPVCGPVPNTGAHRPSTGTGLFLWMQETCGILSFLCPKSCSLWLNSDLSVDLSACNLKSAGVSALPSSLKLCNFISTLLYSLDLSNILISQRNLSEMWTFSIETNSLTPCHCSLCSYLQKYWIFVYLCVPTWTASGYRRKSRKSRLWLKAKSKVKS